MKENIQFLFWALFFISIIFGIIALIVAFPLPIIAIGVVLLVLNMIKV